MQAGPFGASLFASTRIGAEQQVDRQLRSRSKSAAMSLHGRNSVKWYNGCVLGVVYVFGITLGLACT